MFEFTVAFSASNICQIFHCFCFFMNKIYILIIRNESIFFLESLLLLVGAILRPVYYYLYYYYDYYYCFTYLHLPFSAFISIVVLNSIQFWFRRLRFNIAWTVVTSITISMFLFPGCSRLCPCFCCCCCCFISLSCLLAYVALSQICWGLSLPLLSFSENQK